MWVAGILFVLAVLAGGVAYRDRSRYQPERLGRQDRQRPRRPQEPTGGGRGLVRRLCGHVPDLPVEKLYYRLLHTDADGPPALGSLLLVGGALFVALHAVSDVGIYGVLDGKLASFGAQHDHSVPYTLYLLTYAVDSVADIFGSLFALAAGVLVLRSGILPRWLGWTSILAAPLLFLQAFGPRCAIASFGLVLDLIGYVLLLLFVLMSSVILLRQERPAR